MKKLLHIYGLLVVIILAICVNNLIAIRSQSYALKQVYMQTSQGSFKNMSPAYGKLRKWQLINLEYLKIIDKIFTKHNIAYFVEGGTLLGAVRHNGFIPWDDDIDLYVVNDCKRAQDLLEEYKIDMSTRKFNVGVSCVLYAKPEFEKEILRHRKIGRFLSLFRKIPILKKISHLWEKNGVKKYTSTEPTPDIIHSMYLQGRKTSGGMVYVRNAIFPIQRKLFEGYMVPVPNNYDVFLMQQLGNYESLPDDIGYPKHSVSSTQKAKVAAFYYNRTNAQLDEFLKEAQQINLMLK